MSEANKRIDRQDSKDWAAKWNRLQAERQASAAKGESSPWTAMKQWAVEIPLNANMRGYMPPTEANQIIEEREQKAQAELERLRGLSEAGTPTTLPKSPWSGVY